MTLGVQTLSEKAYVQLRDRIVSGEFTPDTPIHQHALAADLGISIIPLREALARLEGDGFIAWRANRGFFVTPLGFESVVEAYALRLKIEPAAVSAACVLATAADKSAARASLDTLNATAEDEGILWGRRNRVFHMLLLGPLRRTVTYQIVENLNVICEAFFARHLNASVRAQGDRRDHTAILALWSMGHSEAVALEIHRHILSAKERLQERFSVALEG